MKQLKPFFLIVFVLLFSTALQAQTPNKTRILFLLDASGSMYAQMDKGQNRWDVAKKMLSGIVDSLSQYQNVEVALRVYGHQSSIGEQNCKDTKLEVPFKKGNHSDMKKRLYQIAPRGTTLIAYSLTQAAYDFPDRTSRNIIILITDGLEECKGDPCAVSEALQKNGVALKPFIIGLGASEEFGKAFECVGRYYDASTEAQFAKALNVVVSQALNSTTVQVNLLDIYYKPSETNVNMTFYDAHSGKMMYNFMHTINDRGYPDTVAVDPSLTYNIVVHTTPEVTREGVEFNPGKHNIVGIDAPQGYLKLSCMGITNYPKLQGIMRRSNDMKTLTLHDFNATRKYIVGKYDLEILSLPRIYMKDVIINQNSVTSISIPQPGKLTINSPNDVWGAIYQMRGNKIELVTELDLTTKQQNIIIQPGTYKIVYRPKNMNRSVYTFEKEFTIGSGYSTIVNL